MPAGGPDLLEAPGAATSPAPALPTASEATSEAAPPVPRRVLLALAALIALALLPWLSGLVGALILAVPLEPLHRRLSRRIPGRWSAGTVAAAVVVLIAVPGSWLVATTIGEAVEAIRALQGSDLIARLDGVRLGGIDVARQVENAGATLLSWLSGRALALFGSATRATLNLCIALFGLYYLLLDGARLGARAAALLHLPPAHAELLVTRFRAVTDALLVGTLLTAAVQGVIVGLGFAVVGLRGPVLWGVITACVSVLPVLGSAIVWLPGVAALALAHRPGAAILLAIIGGGIAANMDNVVRLVAYRRISGIHPMLTLVGAVAGVGIFGMMGVLIGPLVLSYFFELLRLYEVGRRVPPG
ncbi:MAG: AI-2E family transporter [Gemmatimonadaceae bacterium]